MPNAAALPMVADLDGVSGDELFVHGGWHAAFAARHDLSTLWSEDERTSTRSYGARVSCGGAPAVATAQAGDPLIRVFAGADGTVLAEKALAGGAAYADLASIPAEARPGSLGSASAIADLNGSGQAAVLVGGTDGFLYALDACTLDVLWSLDLRYPVGEPIVADTDGDGMDEIVVSVADGFLYGIDRAIYPAPGPVLDLDPAAPGTDDIDEVDSRTQLAASWQSVDGATSYEVAALSPGGTALTDPPYHDVGDVTQTVIDGLSLSIGQRVLIAVRAVGPDGSGAESVSDGVTIRDSRPPDVSVTLSASSVPQGTPSSADVQVQDNWGIANVTVSLLDASGAELGTLAGDLVSGDTTHSLSVPVDTSGLVPGTYTVRASAVDISDQVGMGDATLTVSPANGADGGVSGDGGTAPTMASGCGCRAAGSERAPAPLWLAALAFLLLTRRRSR